MLSIRNLVVYYQRTKALKGVSLEIKKNQLVAIIGANGSGKSTVLRAISGFVNPFAGEIKLNNNSIVGEKPYELVKRGIVHVTQERDLFPELTVQENLKLGAVLQSDRKKIEKMFEDVFEFFPLLHDRKTQIAGTLSGGERRMLAIGRAMMSNPELLLLDEPTSGVAPIYIERINELIRKLLKRGLTILLVEHNAYVAFALSQYYYALRNGEIISEGKTSDLPEDRDDMIFKILYD